MPQTAVDSQPHNIDIYGSLYLLFTSLWSDLHFNVKTLKTSSLLLTHIIRMVFQLNLSLNQAINIFVSAAFGNLKFEEFSKNVRSFEALMAYLLIDISSLS